MVSEDVKAYVSSLADLTFNSKPLINMLTMLADENIEHASEIVEVVETHLTKVQIDVKLPILYLIDCIVKNVGGPYTALFSQNIVATFCSVFRVVDEKTRAEMFKLRQTWNDVFSSKKLYAIDVQISLLDPAWPVTAQLPPSSSIHLNPKFLKNTATTTTKTTPSIPAIPVSSAETATLDMQQQLIQKQKELIELQQKKVELELLQTRVKLQEQIKQGVPSAGLPTRSQNILLKQEVAKQLSTPSSRATSDNKKHHSENVASNAGLLNQRMQPSITNNGPRIAPANSALVAAAAKRPIRDPRLLRQQQRQQKQSNINIALLNVQPELKNILESSNKIVNKQNVRDIHNEPRLVDNKVNNIPPQKLVDAVKPKVNKNLSKSRTDKNNKSSRSNKNNNFDDSKSLSSKSSSTSSLDSPSKKSEKSETSPTKSPTKSPTSRHKKKDLPMDKKNSKRDRDPKNFKPDSPPATFKDIKETTKNRNYIRRNRSVSPAANLEDHQDVDLRVVGPPEKQPRLIGEPASEQKLPIPPPNQSLDVDLRQLPIIGKKRPSIEASDQTAIKKTKTEIFDVLFGNEDTDLRRLNVASTPEQPPTPPPPIISSTDSDDKAKSQEKTNLDVVRAKLANATSKEKLLMKSFKKRTHEDKKDQDLRVNQVSSTTDVQSKIIISPDDAKSIKEGSMTKAQEQQLMNKIIAQFETQKLREAKKKDNEETLGNISLQPISDDEFENDFSDGDDKNLPTSSYGDKDERIHPPHLASEENFHKGFSRDNRRLGPSWRGGRGRRHWEHLPLNPRLPVRPWMPPMHNNWRQVGNFNRPPHPDNLPPHTLEPPILPPIDMDERRSPEFPNTLVVEPASQEAIKTINIDGLPKDIRYYDETAVVFMNWDDPREISFQNGSRRVIFDDQDMYILNFNEPPTELRIGNTLHKVNLGGPSREIYIDSKPYECYFGGPGITIDLNGKNTNVKLDGPPPQVKIGDPRTDLVAGKVNLIIDAKTIVPVFLDAKIQKFSNLGETHTLQFVDGLKVALINDERFDVQFGDLPKPIMLNNNRHYIRFSVLPKGVKPGQVKVQGLECEDSITSPKYEDVDSNEPALPVPPRLNKNNFEASPDNSNSIQLFQNVLQQQNLNNLDFLSSAISSSFEPSTNAGGYQVEYNSPKTESRQDVPAQPAKVSSVPNTLNINDLFQKLVATGIVTTNTQEKLKIPNIPRHKTTPSHPETKSHSRKYMQMKYITFDKPEMLKIRQGQLYQGLYTGMQCSSCGMRFPPEQSMHYSQHLDWHFRQNRKGKKNARVASSRRWYYSVADWQNYEEIEDLEEREKNYFDQQQSQTEGAAEETEEITELPSVTADPELQDICEVCGDKFETFFNEEREEWQFRNAIRIDNLTYHPVCYEDYQDSLVSQSLGEHKIEIFDEDVSKKDTSDIPGIEIVLDDYDSDDKPQTHDEEEEVVIEESDESKPSEDVKNDVDETVGDDKEDDDDDVIIKEEKIEKIIVDDDDDRYDENEEYSPLVTTVKSEPIDDGFMDIGDGLLTIENGGPVKIKSEPIDFDTEYLQPPNSRLSQVSIIELDPDEEQKSFSEEPVHTGIVSSMDGNVEHETGVQTSGISGKIKINISKPLPVIATKENKDLCSESEPLPEPIIDPTQPLPPGEEPVLLKLKPALQGVELQQLPPVQKGSELTGMCSIM